MTYKYGVNMSENDKTDYRNLRYSRILTILVSKEEILKIFSYIREMNGEVIEIIEDEEQLVYHITFRWRNRKKLIEFLEKYEPFLLYEGNNKVVYIIGEYKD